MSVSLVSCLTRPARRASSRSAFLPARLVTRLQRGRSLLHASPLVWTLGTTRSFSWNPFGGASKAEVLSRTPASEAQTPPQPVVEENASAATALPSQAPVEPILTQSDTSTFVDASTQDSFSDSISDSISNAAGTLASHPIPTQYGDMAALGLVSWTPAGFFPWLLEVTQVSTGLPWWGVIILTTIGARTALLPLIVRSSRTQARLAPLQPQLTVLRDKANKARADGDTFAASQAMQQHMALLKRAQVNPLDSVVTAVAQVCVQIGFFIGLRRMCGAPVEQLTVGGFGWITDLAAADPYYITPIVNYALINLQLSVSRRDMLAVGTPSAPHMINGLRIFSALGLPLMIFFPAALNIHLITSIAFISAQTLTLRIPAVRRALSLPPLPPLPQTKPPSMRDSLLRAKEWYTSRMAEVAMKDAERQRKMRMVQRPSPPPPPRK